MSDEGQPSKTRRKKQMQELQALGAELCALSPGELDAMDLPERLRDAVLDARGMTGHEARRRQLQFIGKLMRSVDAEPIRSRIAALKSVSREEVAQFHVIEAWRARLLAEPAALAEFLDRHPGADAQRLRVLIRGAGEERAVGRPPRSFRLLFQALREILEADSRG
jgi:ribosome-associated protein